MRSLFILGVVAVRLVRAKKLTLALGLTNLWLVVGWVIGYWLTEMEDVFYVYMANPEDETGRNVRTLIGAGDWSRAWDLLVATRAERRKMPVHNVLTGLIVAILGVWVVSSSGNILAMGVVLGLSVRLFIGLLMEKDFDKWYWIFARKFTERENKIVLAVWGGLLILQVLFLI